MAKILIFPFSDCDDPFYRYCLSIDHEIVLASSERFNENSNQQLNVELLPYIYDQSFLSEITNMIALNGINTIYSPVTSVHAFLKNQIESDKIEVKLIAESPIDNQQSVYRKLFEQAETAQKDIRRLEPNNRLTVNQIASILRQTKLIYGESNLNKIQAMIAIFASVPKGDVVEIGSLMGRTAFVLSFLSQQYKIGPVLAVDPWSNEIALQKDSPQVFQSTLIDAWDCKILSRAFIVNLLSFNQEQFNYLKMTSEEGYRYWHGNFIVHSEDFGETRYIGKIALIHIDGNHDYEMVKQDCHLWLSKLTKKAWVILDDYIWAHGDGPKRVGDEILASFADKISRSFVCGKALFIQLI